MGDAPGRPRRMRYSFETRHRAVASMVKVRGHRPGRRALRVRPTAAPSTGTARHHPALPLMRCTNAPSQPPDASDPSHV